MFIRQRRRRDLDLALARMTSSPHRGLRHDLGLQRDRALPGQEPRAVLVIA